MMLDELKEMVAIDIDATVVTLKNLHDLVVRLNDKEPDIHELAAFGTYIRDAYTGMENILVRFAKYCGVDIPDIASWHVSLTNLFCEPPAAGLPLLLPPGLNDQIQGYRGFRHVQ